MTLSTRSRSAQGMSLCPSNTGARVSAAPAIASGDCCAAAGVEIRAKAARPASRKDLVMDRDLKGHDAKIDLKFQRAIDRSEEHTSELQSLMRNSYAVFCLKQKKTYE